MENCEEYFIFYRAILMLFKNIHIYKTAEHYTTSKTY